MRTIRYGVPGRFASMVKLGDVIVSLENHADWPSIAGSSCSFVRDPSGSVDTSPRPHHERREPPSRGHPVFLRTKRHPFEWLATRLATTEPPCGAFSRASERPALPACQSCET